MVGSFGRGGGVRMWAVGETDTAEQMTGGRRVLYIVETGGDDEMTAALRACGSEVDVRPDVYRGLAFLGAAGGRSPVGVVVCVDVLAVDANAFFRLAGEMTGGAPVLAYSRRGAGRRIRDAMLAGATGVVEATRASLSAGLRFDDARTAANESRRTPPVGRAGGGGGPERRRDAVPAGCPSDDEDGGCVTEGVTGPVVDSDADGLPDGSAPGPGRIDDGALLTEEEIELLLSGCENAAGFGERKDIG